jgi:hypothetical protein
MHLHKILLASTLLLFACKTSSRLPSSYDNTPVMLHLADIAQHDSIGFNFVKEIQELVYPRLLTGDLPLWENPNKEIIISKERFAQLEKTASRPFVQSRNLFIHEIWQIFKKNYDFATLGFSFTGESKYGKSINYGYVDIIDIISILKSKNIPSNANGSSTLTYWNALQSKKYDFNLVQFGLESFQQDQVLALKIKHQALRSNKVLRELYEIQEHKEIEYKVLSPAINSNKENANFYSTFEKFVNNNKQTILNAGGDEHFNHLMFVPWKIEGIEIIENWTKYNNIAFQELKSILLFIDGHSITLNKKQLEELNMKINLRGIEEYLSEKPFDFVLQRVNNEEVPPNKAQVYYEALLKNNWNNIKPRND